MQKDFDRWNGLKKSLHQIDKNILFFKQGEVWWVSLGVNIGCETDGKGEGYRRPVLILKKYNLFSFLAIPLTTSAKTNPYKVSVGLIAGKEAYAMTSQLRNIDSKRLVSKICSLDKLIFKNIKEKTSLINFG